MAVTYLGNGDYRGLSTDTRPSGATVNNRYHSTDTLEWEEYDGTYWWLAPNAFNPFSTKRWGIYPWGSSNTVGTGMFSSLTAATGAAAQGAGADATHGKYVNLNTGAVDGNNAGHRANANLFIRQHNPRMRFKFQVPTSTDYTTARVFIGFANNVELDGDDPLNARPGVLVGFISGGTNFIVLRNDGSGATDLTGNVAGSAQALDTTAHQVSIVGDEANTRWSVKWDNNAYVHFTTEIPDATTTTTVHWTNETHTAAARTVRVYVGSACVQVDK